MQTLSNEYGPIVDFRLEPFQKVIQISDRDLIREVLVTKQKNFIKSSDVQALRTLVGDGLLTSEKDIHMRQRRLIQPAFKKTHITAYAQDIIDVTGNYISTWKNEMETDITNDMNHITLGIICETMFSMDFKEGNELIGESVGMAMKLAIKRMRSIIPIPLWIPTKTNRDYRRIAQELDKVLLDIIDTRRQEDIQMEDLLGILMRARDGIMKPE